MTADLTLPSSGRRWCRIMLRAAAFTVILAPGAALAQDAPGTHTWQVVPGVTSADLAADEWVVVEATALSNSGGGHVVMSFWERPAGYGHTLVMRCLTTFDASLNQVADVCSRAEH